MNPILFDRMLLRKRRDKAAATLGTHDFLLRESAGMMAESMDMITRRFPTIVELGAHTGQLAQYLRNREGTTNYICCDIAPAMLQQNSGMRVALDEEFLPFADNSLDAVVSNLSLHWVNDLPGALVQIQRALKPDGLFLAMLPGADTLRELRDVFAKVEAARTGGMSARIAPFLEVRDAGNLLQRAGFALPVVDSLRVTVTYETMFAIMDDLRKAGESNVQHGRSKNFTPREFFFDASHGYEKTHATTDGQVKATVELLSMIAWKPDASQQKPAARGSGKISLTDVLS